MGDIFRQWKHGKGRKFGSWPRRRAELGVVHGAVNIESMFSENNIELIIITAVLMDGGFEPEMEV